MSTTVAQYRKFDLSKIKHYQKNYRGSFISVGYSGYEGHISAMGGELTADVSEAQGCSRRPYALDLYESQTHPGDLVGVPTMEVSEDNLHLTWHERGTRANVDMGRLLAAHQIQIPEDSILRIDLYRDTDAELGEVVGFKIKGADFRPKGIRKSSEAQ